MRQVKYRRPKDYVDPFATSNNEQESSNTPPSDHSVRKSHNDRSVLNSGASNHSESFPLITERSSDTNDNQSAHDNQHAPSSRRRGSSQNTSHSQENPESMQKSKSASHVDRIRAVKSQKGAPGPVRSRSQQQPPSYSSPQGINDHRKRGLSV